MLRRGITLHCGIYSDSTVVQEPQLSRLGGMSAALGGHVDNDKHALVPARLG
ncbi:MAG: hypothetical protein HJJLKODD_00755 [Phycisphaerae bacterium]|nr:hypothetical protein [Phycisphaerae bacterium]